MSGVMMAGGLGGWIFIFSGKHVLVRRGTGLCSRCGRHFFTGVVTAARLGLARVVASSMGGDLKGRAEGKYWGDQVRAAWRQSRDSNTMSQGCRLDPLDLKPECFVVLVCTVGQAIPCLLLLLRLCRSYGCAVPHDVCS